MLARFQPIAHPTGTAFFAASVSRFDRARMGAGPRAANAAPAPGFIVGMPRSVTTLAEQILAAHPAVFGAGERVSRSSREWPP